MSENRFVSPSKIDDVAHWLPNLCQPLALLRLLILAIGIGLVLALLRDGLHGLFMVGLGKTLAAAIWIAVMSAAGLCFIGSNFSTKPHWLTVVMSMFWVQSMALLLSFLPILLRLPWLYEQHSLDISIILEHQLIVFIIAAVILRFLYVQYEKNVHRQALMMAEFEALQARIHPHFLFNSLNSMASLVHVDANRAEQALLDLSDMFRATLSSSSTIHSLKDELQLCEKYLAIEKIRMADRLNWQIDCPDELAVILLPALSLQPLFENSVLHGLQPREEGGTIRCEVSREDDVVRILLCNPLPDNDLSKKSSRGNGMAHKNIMARLSHYCQQPVMLQVEQCADSYRVLLEIPLHE